jgi:hypothetical protein
MIFRVGVAGRNRPTEVVAEDAERLRIGGDFLLCRARCIGSVHRGEETLPQTELDLFSHRPVEGASHGPLLKLRGFAHHAREKSCEIRLLG